MVKKQNKNWYLIFAVLLSVASVVLYFLQIVIFKDVRNTFFYLMQDLAFLPVQVLLVSLIINEVLSRREKREKLTKMNMVIGVFFSEAGTNLLKFLTDFDTDIDKLKESFLFNTRWQGKDFLRIEKLLKARDYTIDNTVQDLNELKEFLISKRLFLLGLLQNPNLLEHETFTDLLWAVFHLVEELDKRQDVSNLPDADYAHIAGDIKRAYSFLMIEWLVYLKHLSVDYPYIFSLMVRTNPMDPYATTEIK